MITLFYITGIILAQGSITVNSYSSTLLGSVLGALWSLDGSVSVRDEFNISMAHCLPTKLTAPATIAYGLTASFAVLSESKFFSVGITSIFGDIASLYSSSPSSAITGFPPGTVTGESITLLSPDVGLAQDAMADATTIYSTYSPTSSCDSFLPPVENLPILYPGTYCWSLANSQTTVTLSGNVILRGLSSSSTWVFVIPGNLVVNANTFVSILDFGSPCQILWVVGGSVTFGASVFFQGTILAQSNVIMTSTVNFEAPVSPMRVISLSGIVQLSNIVSSISECYTSQNFGAGPALDTLFAKVNIFAIVTSANVVNTGSSTINGHMLAMGNPYETSGAIFVHGQPFVGFPPGVQINGLQLSNYSIPSLGIDVANQVDASLSSYFGYISEDNYKIPTCNVQYTVASSGTTQATQIQDTIITPGVYCYGTQTGLTVSSTLQISGKIVFRGTASDHWLIRIYANDVSIAANTVMAVYGGAKACNVYWYISNLLGQVTVGTSAQLVGRFVTFHVSTFTMGLGSSLVGSILCETSTRVILNTVNINSQSCLPANGPSIALGSAFDFSIVAKTSITAGAHVNVFGNMVALGSPASNSSYHGFSNIAGNTGSATYSGGVAMSLNSFASIANLALVDATASLINSNVYYLNLADCDYIKLSGEFAPRGIFPPGSYCIHESHSQLLSGEIILYGPSGSNWLFAMDGSFQVESNTRVVVMGGANPCNVVWYCEEAVIGSNVTLPGTIIQGTNSGTVFSGSYQGTFYAGDNLVVGSHTTINGRIFTLDGGVTLGAKTLINGTACYPGKGVPPLTLHLINYFVAC